MVSSPESPITGVVVVADKGRCPIDFAPIDKAHDDPASEADIWKDGFFAFSRVYRYLAVSKVPPKGAFVVNVLADLAIGNQGDPVPPGFIPLETTEDTKEKALRKKQISVRMVPRASAVDAVSDIVCLARAKRPPQGYTLAGEIDGVAVCFKYSVIPQDFPSTSQNPGGGSSGGGLYPAVSGAGGGLPYPLKPSGANGATEATSQAPPATGLAQMQLTQRQDSAAATAHGVDGVPFKLHPSLANRDSGGSQALPSLPHLDLDGKFAYSFHMEQQVLTTQLST